MKVEFESGRKNSDRTWLNVYFLLEKKNQKIKPIQETCNVINQRKQIYELLSNEKYAFVETVRRKGKFITGITEVEVKEGEIKILKEEGFPLKFNLL